MFVKIKRKRWDGTSFGDCKKDISGANQLSGKIHNEIINRINSKTDMRGTSSILSLKEIKS